MSYTYYPMHMHLHTCFQPGMSMAAHMYNARKLGMKYIWFTDHDSATGIGKRSITGYSFEDDVLNKGDHGFFEAEFSENASFSYTIDGNLKQASFTAQADERPVWQSGGVYFHSTGHRHNPALLMETSLRIGLSAGEISQDTRLVLDVTLSQRPPECKKSHILYVLGDPSGLEAEDHQIIPLKIKNGFAELPLYLDVSDDIMIGGKDNVFDTLTVTLQVRSGAVLSADIRDFQIRFNKNFEQAHLAQKEEAARVGKLYDITPFVAFEFSKTEHKNCFSSNVPTLNLAEMNWKVSNSTVADHTRKHNGIFAINHPLAISLLKRKEFDPMQRLNVVARSAAALLSCDAYGASLVEVGYPMGRNGFDLQAYLLHWDLLSSGGLFLTGYGCNDCHRNNENWFEGNNFATWIGVDSSCQHPVNETEFVNALRKGRVYTGDPVKIKGPVSFETKEGFQQGSVFTTDRVSELTVCFRAQDVKPGWKFRLIENSHEVFFEEITGSEYSHTSVLKASPATVSFQRAELYDTDGRCILLTNPIYLVKPDELAREIPECRLAEVVK